MRRLLMRWCWLCTAFGAVLVLSSAAAIAQDANGAVMGFQARDLITGLCGLLLMVIGAYTAGFRGRVDKLEGKVESLTTALSDFQRLVAKDYHDKGEVGQRFDHVDRSVEAIHRRLDALNVPQGPRG